VTRFDAEEGGYTGKNYITDSNLQKLRIKKDK
jgi:hypothetical protein